MSYDSMLKHRVNLYRITVEENNGIPVTTWNLAAQNVAAFVDLNFIRRGKDPVWTQEAGRPQDRTGVLFIKQGTDIRSGDRLTVVRGPTGSFQVEGAVDEAWRPEEHHHTEVGIVEVSKQLTPGWAGQGGGSDSSQLPGVSPAKPLEVEGRWGD